MKIDRQVEALLRSAAPQALGTLMRRHGQFDLCEDAIQEALLAAVTKWPQQGLPDSPVAWLVTVAERRLTDRFRSEHARRRREDTSAAAGLRLIADDDGDVGQSIVPAHDDTLLVLFMCCHPSLPRPSQLALTLRAVGGLTTAEIAHACLVPEATMAQRISRAKQRIRESGDGFELPEGEQADRLGVVLHVLYLIFNEGYTTSSGRDLQRTDLTSEAIRLTRAVHHLLPDDGEVAGLLALMLLTDARRAARTDVDGSLVPLAEQDRRQWDRQLIEEGVGIITAALATTPLGPYQLQAAIAAVHDEADDVGDTDWLQILGLYDLLERLSPNPVVALNRTVAVAEVHGPDVALALLDELAADDRMTNNHRLHSVRAHLLERIDDRVAARAEYLTAARFTTSLPEKRYLEERAARLGQADEEPVISHHTSPSRQSQVNSPCTSKAVAPGST